MKKLVILTGAGISAESGIKTFRDSGGLWEGYDVYEVASPSGWAKNPELVLNFYNQRRRDLLQAKPNEAHFGLAELENNFDVTIITQNIDDLHERAGSSKILHLHGELLKMRSIKNTSVTYPIIGDISIGDLAPDGAQLRPHIVWFDEPVPLITSAVDTVSRSDIFVVIGTSLVVYPAAGLINCARADIPKFIIDPNIPNITEHANLFTIETTATAGVKLLKERLHTYI